jgi:hypothetical protein
MRINEISAIHSLFSFFATYDSMPSLIQGRRKTPGFELWGEQAQALFGEKDGRAENASLTEKERSWYDRGTGTNVFKNT